MGLVRFHGGAVVLASSYTSANRAPLAAVLHPPESQYVPVDYYFALVVAEHGGPTTSNVRAAGGVPAVTH